MTSPFPFQRKCNSNNFEPIKPKLKNPQAFTTFPTKDHNLIAAFLYTITPACLYGIGYRKDPFIARILLRIAVFANSKALRIRF